jgi:uncharacterized protein YqeY
VHNGAGEGEAAMSVRAKIEADLKQAMLQKDEVSKDALRMMKAELLNREVELARELEDKEAFAIIQKSVKSRRDSIDQYRQNGRNDLVEIEEKQLSVVERYVPKQMSEDEMRIAVSAIIKELGLTTKKDMGKLMKELSARHDNVDGKTASKLAGELLA